MKKRRVTFNLEPEIKEFYKNDVVYGEQLYDYTYLYVLGAVFVTFIIIKFK